MLKTTIRNKYKYIIYDMSPPSKGWGRTEHSFRVEIMVDITTRN